MLVLHKGIQQFIILEYTCLPISKLNLLSLRSTCSDKLKIVVCKIKF